MLELQSKRASESPAVGHHDISRYETSDCDVSRDSSTVKPDEILKQHIITLNSAQYIQVKFCTYNLLHDLHLVLENS